MMQMKKFKYFVLVAIMPLLSIVIMFSYAFVYVKEEIDIHSSKIKALGIIKEVEKIIFDIQATRGFSCLENPNEKSIKNLQAIRKDITKNLNLLRKKLIMIKDNSLRKDLSEFLHFLEDNYLEDMNFNQLNQIVYKFMFFSHRISYSFELPLKSNLNDYLLTNNIVYLIPEIIEYNGQIRAAVSNNKLSEKQKNTVLLHIDKIEDKIKKLEENIFLLHVDENHNVIKKNYKKMTQAQKNITNYAKNVVSNNDTSVEANKAFELITKNIEIIMELYTLNLNFLEKSLKENKQLSTYILFAGLLSILFVIYINILFYNKNKKFVNKIEELTITDDMTGLYNRRHFDEVFENSLKIQQRTKQTLVFLMLDIDFFKSYNDTYGHQAGDLAIKSVAKNLKNVSKRAGDMAFRLGGEEFGILCWGMNESEALDFANKIRENIENEKIEHKENKVSDYLTVSMGVKVIMPNIMNTTNEIYKYTDEILYKAKKDGRNMVIRDN